MRTAAPLLFMLGSCLVSLAACGDTNTPIDGAVDASTDGGPTSGMCAGASDCDDGLFCNGEEQCSPEEPGADARGCVAAALPCGTETCDEDGDTCVQACPDADGDGHRALGCGGDDCDDGDANAYPGNAEVCDTMDHDEDCDARTFGVRDLDGDFSPDATCCNESGGGSRFCGDDCDDSRANAAPTAVETCDGLDNDCDGALDEGVMRSFWPDEDEDGFGDDDASPTMGCTPPGLRFVERAGDCDDANAFAHRTTAPEVCDGEDNDCDGASDEETSVVPWYLDNDRDGWGDSDAGTVDSCPPIAGRVTAGGDCDDANPMVNPGVPELCNGTDDDCDDSTDEGVQNTYYLDSDMDGQGDPAMTMLACSLPAGHATAATDCDDSNGSVYRGAPEQCDLIFNDCALGSGARPEEDDDLDGYGDRTLCDPTVVGGGLMIGPDCNDLDRRINPSGAPSAMGFCPDNLERCSGSGCDRCGAPGCTCAEGTADLSYDRNCNGTLEVIVQVFTDCNPSSSTMCSTASCSARSGFDAFPPSTACGSLADYTTCRCQAGPMSTNLCRESTFGSSRQLVPCR